MSRPTSGAFEKTVNWLDWFDGPAKPPSPCQPARSTPIATCSAPAQSSPTRLSASTRRAMPARRNCLRCVIIWGSPAT